MRQITLYKYFILGVLHPSSLRNKEVNNPYSLNPFKSSLE